VPSETLKDFLVSLQFKVDEASQRKFDAGLLATVTAANRHLDASRDDGGCAAAQAAPRKRLRRDQGCALGTGATTKQDDHFRYLVHVELGARQI